ncbi:unnamed protein product [Rhizoctonia solani]|uniref:Uncharacterized protein n=1 Tax=Rhizoctonia solani TaxID=456999 RepID=A0A8H3HDH6_9AGAM|nr:unnamed protein product [Rhizoctonia solani]
MISLFFGRWKIVGRHADALQFIPLDLKTPDPPPLLFDISFDEFTVDPEQGLIAIVSKNLGLLVLFDSVRPRNCLLGGFDRFTTIHVDLYSITTGLAHLHAQYPRLTVEFAFERPFFSPELDIEIMGNVLLIKASRSRFHAYELLIWDWRSGIFLNRITTRQGICDFTFLDKQHLVVLSGTRSDPDSEALGTLELLVYTISDGISTCSNLLHGQLRVADLVVSQPTLRLAFPQIQESCTISDTEFYLRSDPTPGRILYTHSAAYACSYTTTLSINFYVRNVNTGWEGPDYYRVFLDGRFLMDQLRTYNSNETVHVPWSSWGVCATRWFITTERPNHWICRMSSSRFISQLSDQPYYCILDFSSANVGRSRGCALQSNPPGLDGLDVTKDSGLGVEFEGLRRLEQDLRHFPADSPAGHELLVATVGADNPGTISGIGFEEPITSRLPYRIVCRMNNQSDHEGWQINGDCIVGVATRGIASESLTIYKLKKQPASSSNF